MLLISFLISLLKVRGTVIILIMICLLFYEGYERNSDYSSKKDNKARRIIVFSLYTVSLCSSGIYVYMGMFLEN